MKIKKLNCRGQGLTEYLVLLLFIAMVSMVAIKKVGTKIRDNLGKVETDIDHITWERNN